MFLEGFFVSPAVIPKLSVPPSVEIIDSIVIGRQEAGSPQLTGEACRHKHTSKPTKSSHEGCAGKPPILTTNITVLRIDSYIDKNTNYDEHDDRYHFQ